MGEIARIEAHALMHLREALHGFDIARTGLGSLVALLRTCRTSRGGGRSQSRGAAGGSRRIASRPSYCGFVAALELAHEQEAV